MDFEFEYRCKNTGGDTFIGDDGQEYADCRMRVTVIAELGYNDEPVITLWEGNREVDFGYLSGFDQSAILGRIDNYMIRHERDLKTEYDLGLGERQCDLYREES